jgi:hypothetical protein
MAGGSAMQLNMHGLSSRPTYSSGLSLCRPPGRTPRLAVLTTGARTARATRCGPREKTSVEYTQYVFALVTGHTRGFPHTCIRFSPGPCSEQVSRRLGADQLAARIRWR